MQKGSGLIHFHVVCLGLGLVIIRECVEKFSCAV